MNTEGDVMPETVKEARERYRALAPAASEVVRATTREMGFDGAEFRERVTDDVRTAAQDVMFASLLSVRVGTREEFDEWRETYTGEIQMAGSDNVENVVWHAPPWADTAIATSFQNEREAAVAMARRQAFGQLYREVVR